MAELGSGGYEYHRDNAHNVDAASVLINAGEGEKATVTYGGVTYVGIVELNRYKDKSIVVEIKGGEHDGEWVRINWSKDL